MKIGQLIDVLSAALAQTGDVDVMLAVPEIAQPEPGRLIAIPCNCASVVHQADGDFLVLMDVLPAQCKAPVSVVPARVTA